MKLTIKHKITEGAKFEVSTKDELFGFIRQITREGYFFEIRNYYDKSGRSAYMINVLSHNSK